MTQHLREDELSSILAGDARQEWLRHIKQCNECAETLEREQTQIEQWKTLVVTAGARPESYWAAQHARIHARLQERNHGPRVAAWRFAAATLAMVLAIAAVVVTHPRTVAPTVARINPQQQQQLTDDQLMQEMEEVATSEVPTAMEPANVLAEDMEYHADSTSSQSHINKNDRQGR